MRGSRPVASYRPKGYGEPVKTAHYDLACLFAINDKQFTTDKLLYCYPEYSHFFVIIQIFSGVFVRKSISKTRNPLHYAVSTRQNRPP